MQTLDVISVNIWQILISLANLVILFLLIKKFLFKPVKNVLAKRQAEIEGEYDKADRANEEANQTKQLWDEKIQGAKSEADSIIQSATDNAKYREKKILEDAKSEAANIMLSAKSEAELERKKAEAGIKEEIVDVSEELARKLLEREINPDDHRRLIDSFLSDMENGDSDE